MVQIIIPMSGVGQRFINDGYKVPKPLIIVDEKPMIEHVTNLFPNETDVSFICNSLHLNTTDMEKTIKGFCPTGKIYEVPLENREGPVHAVSLIFEHIKDDEEVIVSYCDYGTMWDYVGFLKDTRDRQADGAIACYKGFHPHMLGTDNYAFLKEKDRWMEKIQEKKPFTDDKMKEYASNGTYYFKNGKILKKYFQRLMDLKLKVKGEYYVSMVYNLMVEDQLNVSVFEIEHMLQWGTPYDLEVYEKWSLYFKNIILQQPSFIDEINTTTILPLAGKGSRFSKVGYVQPKPLLDINGYPMVIQAIKCLPQSKNNTFVCLKEHITEYNLDKKIKNIYKNSTIIELDKVTEGQACTTELGLGVNLEDPILITACDNGVYYDSKKYQSLIKDTDNDIIVWTFKNETTSKQNPNMYAWLETDENDLIKKVSCKKFIEDVHNKKDSHVIIGTMFFRKARYFLEGLKKNYIKNIRTNGEFYVDDVLNQNIKAGLKVKAFQVINYICWGTPNDYKTYNYWQKFFHKCNCHPYRKEIDITLNKS